jgi:hypothetical protein
MRNNKNNIPSLAQSLFKLYVLAARYVCCVHDSLDILYGESISLRLDGKDFREFLTMEEIYVLIKFFINFILKIVLEIEIEINIKYL